MALQNTYRVQTPKRISSIPTCSLKSRCTSTIICSVYLLSSYTAPSNMTGMLSASMFIKFLQQGILFWIVLSPSPLPFKSLLKSHLTQRIFQSFKITAPYPASQHLSLTDITSSIIFAYSLALLTVSPVKNLSSMSIGHLPVAYCPHSGH